MSPFQDQTVSKTCQYVVQGNLNISELIFTNFTQFKPTMAVAAAVTAAELAAETAAEAAAETVAGKRFP